MSTVDRVLLRTGAHCRQGVVKDRCLVFCQGQCSTGLNIMIICMNQHFGILSNYLQWKVSYICYICSATKQTNTASVRFFLSMVLLNGFHVDIK